MAKRQFIGENQRQLPALERPRDGGAADLLPVSPRLLVAHDEVLVIDAGQMKRQPQAVYISPPHQTGVTERSIGRHDRDAAHHVIDDVMVRHAADRIRARLPADSHGNHLLGPIQLDIARCAERGMRRSGWNISS